MRTSRWLLGGLSLLALPIAGATTACGSSSSSSSATEMVLGDYQSAAPGLISKVTFAADGQHYSMVRAVCAHSENSCVEHGTYALASGYDSIAFTEETTGTTTSLPFQATRTAPAESLSAQSLRTLGGIGLTSGGGGDAGVSLGGEAGVGLGGQDGGVNVCLTPGGGDGGALVVSVNISLVFSFSLGGQSFSGGVTVSLGGAGGCKGDGGGGGMGGNGGGSDGGGGGGDGAGGGGSDGGGGGSDGGASSDGGADAASDGGDASGTFPAFTPWMPQVVNNGGPVIASPQIVTITYPGDPNVSTYEAFGDALGSSSYWTTVASQYAVGAATSGTTNHVHLTQAAPATIADTDLETFIVSSSSGWPSPSSNTIYELYMPSSTNLTIGGSPACGSPGGGYTGGYHSAVSINGQAVAYAIVTNCASQNVDLPSILQASSHEIVEAATDPQPNASPAYLGFADAYLAWDIFQSFQDEIGDACEFYPESMTTDPLGTSQSFGVQRMWSNQGAAAGSALCVPASSGSNPYYNVTPLNLQTVSVNAPSADYLHPNGGTVQAQGYSIASGQSQTFQIGYYSSAATSGPWTVTAAEGIPQEISGVAPTTGHLTVSIDTTSGQNGTTANVTVTVNSVDTSINGEVVTFASTLGSETHYMPVLISNAGN